MKKGKYVLLLVLFFVFFPINGLAEGCQGLFTEDAWNLTRDIFKIITIAIPIVLIAFGSYDMISVIAAGDQGEVKKAWSRLLKRVIAAIATFLVPTLIMLLLNLPPVKSALNLVDDPTCGITSGNDSSQATNVDR